MPISWDTINLRLRVMLTLRRALAGRGSRFEGPHAGLDRAEALGEALEIGAVGRT
jgi:hypothetical protein